jgi:hypothetical protein
MLAIIEPLGANVLIEPLGANVLVACACACLCDNSRRGVHGTLFVIDPSMLSKILVEVLPSSKKNATWPGTRDNMCSLRPCKHCAK